MMSQALSKTVGCSLLPKQDTCNHKHPALPAGDDDPWSCMCIIAKAFFCFGRDIPIVQGTPWWLPAWIASPAKAEALPSEGASALDIAKAPTQAHVLILCLALSNRQQPSNAYINLHCQLALVSKVQSNISSLPRLQDTCCLMVALKA